MSIKYRFTDTEINKLLKGNLVILYDTREQVNEHVLAYFDKMKIKSVKQKIDEGDYAALITKAPELGIHRDLYFKVGVERKNGVDELAGNLCEKTDSHDDIRFERELMRAKLKGIKMFLVVEDKNGLENIMAGKYRSQYKPQAFMGKLTSIQDKYLQGIIFTDKKDTGYHIYRTLYYAVRNFLKEGEMDLAPEGTNS